MTKDILKIDSKLPGLQPEASPQLSRIGRQNDGGYVIPSSVLSDTDYLVSGGYGNDFSFEKDFLQKSGVKTVTLYDFSITFSRLVFNFTNACLSIALRRNHYALSYHLQNIVTYVRLKAMSRISLVHSKLTSSGYEDGLVVSNLEGAFNTISGDNNELFFCKLDIEGFEYELIQELVSLNSRISGLVIEFHETDSRREIFLESLKLLKPHYVVVHTHVNNYGGFSADGQPIVYEITFLNRKMFPMSTMGAAPSESLTPEDQPNDPNSPEVNLIFG
jgi:hypothetical protein